MPKAFSETRELVLGLLKDGKEHFRAEVVARLHCYLDPDKLYHMYLNRQRHHNKHYVEKTYETEEEIEAARRLGCAYLVSAVINVLKIQGIVVTVKNTSNPSRTIYRLKEGDFV